MTNVSTVIIDLDETLVSTTQKEYTQFERYQLSEEFSGEFVHLRPYTREFIEWLIANTRTIIWTAGTEDYAEQVSTILFGDTPPYRTFSRHDVERAMNVYGNLKPIAYLRDIRLVPELEDMRKVVIIDNHQDVYSHQCIHAIRVPDFNAWDDDAVKDNYLLDVINLLIKRLGPYAPVLVSKQPQQWL